MRLHLFPIVLVACTLASTGFANTICADRKVIVERLVSVFDEQRKSIGQARDGRVVEVFQSGAAGSWTLVVSKPGAPACIMASGKGAIPMVQIAAFESN
jgi:hypothetical protein